MDNFEINWKKCYILQRQFERNMSKLLKKAQNYIETPILCTETLVPKSCTYQILLFL